MGSQAKVKEKNEKHNITAMDDGTYIFLFESTACVMNIMDVREDDPRKGKQTLHEASSYFSRWNSKEILSANPHESKMEENSGIPK